MRAVRSASFVLNLRHTRCDWFGGLFLLVSGVGPDLSLDRTRRLLALRINVLAKGYSGVRPETVERMLAFLNSNCLPRVPQQGSVGASGDLAPLCTQFWCYIFVIVVVLIARHGLPPQPIWHWE
jgi:hypothetical protein